MNLKMILSQIDLLPESDVARHINSLLYPIRRPMLLEAAKDEPNMTLISTLRALDEQVSSSAPERVHTLDSTALFVFQAQADERDEATRKNDALKRVMAMVADGRAPRPKSKAEIDKLVALEMQRHEDQIADNFGKAVDAVALINSIVEPEYDEAELPEWITEAIVAKIVDIGVSTYKDAQRRLTKARFDFQRLGPNAAREGALKLLHHFGVTEDEVDKELASAREMVNELFDRLMNDTPEVTIDNPPPENKPEEKAKRYRVQKQKGDGISSADMAAANGVK